VAISACNGDELLSKSSRILHIDEALWEGVPKTQSWQWVKIFLTAPHRTAWLQKLNRPAPHRRKDTIFLTAINRKKLMS